MCRITGAKFNIIRQSLLNETYYSSTFEELSLIWLRGASTNFGGWKFDFSHGVLSSEYYKYQNVVDTLCFQIIDEYGSHRGFFLFCSFLMNFLLFLWHEIHKYSETTI